MILTVNGRQHTFEEAAISLSNLIKHLGSPGHIIAVEINGAIIKPGTINEHMLQDGDHIEILSLVGGG